MLPLLKNHYESAAKLQYGPMEIFPCMVNAEMASVILEANINNRKLVWSTVNKYATDMAKEKWRLTPIASICFDQENRLGNGQHTLNAIVKSGNPQLLLVALNVPRESIAMMDVGRNRTIQDISHFIGSDFDSPCAAIAKIMRFGKPLAGGRGAMSFETLYGIYEYYREAIDFSILLTKGVKVSGVNAITRSAVAMAWYTQDHDRLAEFMQCLKTGVVNGKADIAAAKLRDLFMKGNLNGGGSVGRLEIFAKTKSALEHFLAYRPVSKLYGTDKDIFIYPRLEA
jgi:hypothetical protein